MSALESGETAEVIVSICLLAQGTYELSCVVEEAEASEGAATKRVFSAREPLTLHVDR